MMDFWLAAFVFIAGLVTGGVGVYYPAYHRGLVSGREIWQGKIRRARQRQHGALVGLLILFILPAVADAQLSRNHIVELGIRSCDQAEPNCLADGRWEVVVIENPTNLMTESFRSATYQALETKPLEAGGVHAVAWESGPLQPVGMVSITDDCARTGFVRVRIAGATFRATEIHVIDNETSLLRTYFSYAIGEHGRWATAPPVFRDAEALPCH